MALKNDKKQRIKFGKLNLTFYKNKFLDNFTNKIKQK